MDRPRTSVREDYNEEFVLERDRRRNDLRLKSAFESIFARYSRDFTNVGDEIDLETGEIIVNNGHLSHMRDEQDLGEDDAGRLLRSLVTGQEIDNTSTADEDEVAPGRRDPQSNDVPMEDSDSEYADGDRYAADNNHGSEQDEQEQEESEGDALDPSLMNNVWNDVPDINGLQPAPQAAGRNQIPFNTAALQVFSQTIATQIAQFMAQAFQPLQPSLAIPQGRSGSALRAQPQSTRTTPRPRERSVMRPARRSMPDTVRRQRRSPRDRPSIWALPPEYTSPPRKRRSYGQGARRTVRSADDTIPLGELEGPPARSSTHAAIQDNAVPEDWTIQPRELPDRHSELDETFEPSETESDYSSEVVHLVGESEEWENADEAVSEESASPEPVAAQAMSKQHYSANTKIFRSNVMPRMPFKKEDDDLIVKLYLQQRLSWREIAEYFPGRTQWALENRYHRFIRPNLPENIRDETKDEIDQIVDLRENQGLSWEKIAERLPRFTPSAVRGRYYRKKLSEEGEERCLRIRKNLTNEDVLLLELRETKMLSWEDIAPHFPNRKISSLKNHYYKNLRLPGTQVITPRRKLVTEEEDARLVELKDVKCLTWLEIVPCFPGCSVQWLRQRYYMLRDQNQKKALEMEDTSNEELHSQGTENVVTSSWKQNGDTSRDYRQPSSLGVPEKDGLPSQSAVQSDPQNEPHASSSSRPNVVSLTPPLPNGDEHNGKTLAELLAGSAYQPQSVPVSRTASSIPIWPQQVPTWPQQAPTWPQQPPVWTRQAPIWFQQTPQSVPARPSPYYTRWRVATPSDMRALTQGKNNAKVATTHPTPVRPEVTDTPTQRAKRRRRIIEDTESEDELAQG